uniref:Integrase core domain-containing protein n=1 Tax=Amphimedon queenslandica TaxID=400682 RepID=A0A1X7T6U0_AMPQE
MAELKSVISELKRIGCSTKEIQYILQPVKQISLRHIQRITNGLGSGARNSLEDVMKAINEELKGPGSLLGYRSLWHRLQMKYKLSVSRDTVMMLLAVMDPDGTKVRKSRRLKRRVYLNKGPNYLWHLDGYDKLKPYGITIYGCIDGQYVLKVVQGYSGRIGAQKILHFL